MMQEKGKSVLEGIKPGDRVYIKTHHWLRWWDIDGAIRQHKGEIGTVISVNSCPDASWPIYVQFDNGCRHVIDAGGFQVVPR